MALSEREQRLLEEMERSLYSSESDVLETSPGVQRRPNYRAIVIGILLVLLGIGILLGGVIANMLWLGVIGFAAMLGGVLYIFSPRNQTVTETSNRGQGGEADRKRNVESLSERAARRWEERQEGER
ncbi:DUF3040 domain-containing protein [Leucobacter sp. M11]|uniref:DUF3040 domain-containing protein n=1 Tax=Leucobacter sp. M11 TaxID=2993565 RepID=UPI002D80310B|nr:DUF3040 domain-containing protein [Leucobacter sp. M11]MEB4616567.1 DUF3040 domain-containing protein [Leucobacter sp. M11]